MAGDGPDNDVRALGLEEALERLRDAERMAAILEARLHQYQGALESINSLAGKALEG